MIHSNTILTTNIIDALENVIAAYPAEAIFLLTDTNTRERCLPLMLQSEKLKNSKTITIEAGDNNKGIASLTQIWQFLSENGATRKSLLINIGGGMITDIGGFAAATFKRGIEYINVSTTLLGAVDAATGGKTGINFLGYKNEIGAFAPAKQVLIDVNFFKTLDNKNMRSGYAEMIKHALIYTKEDWAETLKFDLEEMNFEKLRLLLQRNINIKEDIVAQDPKENGIRKALNFGHTIGHAIETLSYRVNRPLLHGYAIAYGMVAETYLSVMKLGFSKDEYLKIKYFIKENYGTYDCGCNDYEELLKLMTHDKKNDSKAINFTLLHDVGNVAINQIATNEEIIEALDALNA